MASRSSWGWRRRLLRLALPNSMWVFYPVFGSNGWSNVRIMGNRGTPSKSSRRSQQVLSTMPLQCSFRIRSQSAWDWNVCPWSVISLASKNPRYSRTTGMPSVVNFHAHANRLDSW